MNGENKIKNESGKLHQNGRQMNCGHKTTARSERKNAYIELSAPN